MFFSKVFRIHTSSAGFSKFKNMVIIRKGNQNDIRAPHLSSLWLWYIFSIYKLGSQHYELLHIWIVPLMSMGLRACTKLSMCISICMIRPPTKIFLTTFIASSAWNLKTKQGSFFHLHRHPKYRTLVDNIARWDGDAKIQLPFSQLDSL